MFLFILVQVLSTNYKVFFELRDEQNYENTGESQKSVGSHKIRTNRRSQQKDEGICL